MNLIEAIAEAVIRRSHGPSIVYKDSMGWGSCLVDWLEEEPSNYRLLLSHQELEELAPLVDCGLVQKVTTPSDKSRRLLRVFNRCIVVPMQLFTRLPIESYARSD